MMLRFLLLLICGTAYGGNLVKIQRDDGGWGSGVYIGDRKVVTAWHVRHIPSTVAVRVVTSNATYETKLVREEYETDSALLEVDREIPGSVPVVIGDKPAIGEELVSYGWLEGPRRRFNGRVNMLGPTSVWHTGNAELGNSGGPTFNTRGELVGVVSGHDAKTRQGCCVGLIQRLLGR